MAQKYLPAQSKIGDTVYNPLNSVLTCPSSVDIQGGQSPAPPTQEDALGARYFGINASGYARAATSYGINAWQDVQFFAAAPFNDYPMSNSNNLPLSLTRLHKFAQVRDSANMIAIFDGIWMLNGSTTRINARHNARQKTNLLFLDGHATTATTKSLPHDGPPNYDLYSALSCSKTSDGAKWRLDQ